MRQDRSSRDPGPVLTLSLVLGCLVASAFATPFDVPDRQETGLTILADGTTVTSANTANTANSSAATDGASSTPANGSSGPTQSSSATTETAGQPSTSAATPAATSSQAQTQPEAADGASYQGVTATSVLWGVSAQKNGCGGFDQGEIQRGFGINSNAELNYELMVEYWNSFPLVDYPLPPEIRKHVNPENGYWGRKIETVFRDSGGYACQDVGRANAVRMAEEDLVFGLIMPPTDGPEVPMSLVMAQHQLIHIGRWLTGPMFWGPRQPYFFDGRWGSNISHVLAQGSWICRDWVGQLANDTGDPMVSGLPRNFGITYPDVPDFTEAVDHLDEELARCGLEGAGHYGIPFDLSTLAANAQTVVTRMRSDGVTTIVSVNDFLTRLLMMEAATQQNWHPEWVVSGMGNGSFPGTYSTFMTPDQAANVWGAVDNAAVTDGPYTETEAYVAFKRIRPNEEPDDGWVNFYEQFKLLALGMAGAGPNLTPQTFAQGLYTLCNPCHQDSPLDRLERITPDDPTDIEGFTLVKWDPDRICTPCKPDANGNAPAGYFDFLEDGKRYGLTIRDPVT